MINCINHVFKIKTMMLTVSLGLVLQILASISTTSAGNMLYNIIYEFV